jgi:RHS repeat-associated protein
VDLTLTTPRNDRSRAYSLKSGRSTRQMRRRWSGRDEQRTVVKRNSYAPFGETFAPTVIDGTGYTGHVMDQATGLTYMQQRYYDPQIGRFLSTDPMPADPDSGANFSSYWYANNNPYRFTDPDGRAAATDEPEVKPDSEVRPEPCDIECKRRKQAEREKHNSEVWGTISTFASQTAAENPAPQWLVDGAMGWASGAIAGASLGLADASNLGLFDIGYANSESTAFKVTETLGNVNGSFVLPLAGARGLAWTSKFQQFRRLNQNPYLRFGLGKPSGPNGFIPHVPMMRIGPSPGNRSTAWLAWLTHWRL